MRGRADRRRQYWVRGAGASWTPVAGMTMLKASFAVMQLTVSRRRSRRLLRSMSCAIRRQRSEPACGMAGIAAQFAEAELRVPFKSRQGHSTGAKTHSRDSTPSFRTFPDLFDASCFILITVIDADLQH